MFDRDREKVREMHKENKTVVIETPISQIESKKKKKKWV